ncbi:MAG: FAD-dependent monooxygenase [Thermomonas sp.]
MSTAFDAIIIGAGPAGTTAAIRLASAGWSVAIVEKREFPRRKVCGECIAASNLPLLDALGIGEEFDALAGPDLRRVGLFVGQRKLIAPLPPMPHERHRWGRALGREHLDTLLLARAAAVGARVFQPWAVKQHDADGDMHRCTLVRAGEAADMMLQAPVLIHAHGSWEPIPRDGQQAHAARKPPHRNGDLLAFKSTWLNARIEPGLLPVLAFPGGYGGMVLGDHSMTTLAFCIRRDALQHARADHPGASAAEAAFAHVRNSCGGIAEVVDSAMLSGSWLAVGPLQPGIRTAAQADGQFAIGNAAGEAHPILGEGMSMAIQSAWLLSDQLIAHRAQTTASAAMRPEWSSLGAECTRAWRANFAPRLRFAAVSAHLAMRPHMAAPLLPLLQRWPGLLTSGARLAGKVRQPALSATMTTHRQRLPTTPILDPPPETRHEQR